jgi:hypothetical protein
MLNESVTESNAVWQPMGVYVHDGWKRVSYLLFGSSGV